MGSRFLDALAGKNGGRAPIWFMRQAGRYLPEYRALREKHSLYDLFFTPELARDVTLLPLQRFRFDAAIVFSDISVVAKALGLDLQFIEGPKVTPFVTRENWQYLVDTPDKLLPIYKAISLLKKVLTVPLIGFSGAPFTVASYLIGSMDKTKEWMHKNPESFLQLLQRIETVTLDYLKKQEALGVDAIQIFDSWANALTAEEFFAFTFPFLEKVLQEIKVPVLFFMREGAKHIEALKTLDIGLSLGPEVCLQEMRKKTRQPLQGNLDPGDLFLPLPVLEKKVRSILGKMQGDRAFIFNLGHGIQPNTPIAAVDLVLQCLQTL